MGDLFDVADAHRERADEMRVRLPRVEGANGIAVALADKVVSVDLFDKPTTVAKIWDRMVLGLAIELLDIQDTGCQASQEDVLSHLHSLRQMDSPASSAGWFGRSVSFPR